MRCFEGHLSVNGFTEFWFAVCLLLTASLNGNAQTNTLVNEGSAPIPGSGHTYINGLAETVMPANGSVSLKIALPTPPGRGLSFPFAFTYNSGSVHKFSTISVGNDGIDWVDEFFLPDRSTAGWSDTFPYTSALGLSFTEANGTSGPQYYCGVTTAYNFYDFAGGSHPLGLASINPSASGNGGAGCNNASIHSGSYSYQYSSSGGDDEVSAASMTYCDNVTAATTCTAQPTPVICDGNPSALNCGGAVSYNGGGGGAPFIVTDSNGTKYNFPGNQISELVPPYSQSSVAVASANSFVMPSSMEDRNGNTVTFTPSDTNDSQHGLGLPITDTLGRTVVSATDSQGQAYVGRYPSLGTHPGSGENVPLSPITYTVGALQYSVNFTTTSAHYTEGYLKIDTLPGQYYQCGANFTANDSPYAVVGSISAPNGGSYQFKYDSTYGLVNEVDYPDGGWVKYTWEMSPTYTEATTFSGVSGSASNSVLDGACVYEYQTPVILTRTIGYSQNSAAAQTQTFSYKTQWNSSGQWTSKTTTVNTTDNVTGQATKTIYNYGPVGRPIQVNEWGQAQAQLPVETSIQTFDLGNGGSSDPLKTVNQTWGDQFQMTSQQTTIGLAPASQVVYCYEGNTTLVQEKDEYGFGVAGPSSPAAQNCGSPTPTRSTIYNYYVVGSTPCQTIVKDSNGNRAAETDVYLDGASTPCLTGGFHGGVATMGVPNLVTGSHDETQYGPSSTKARGNPTKVVKWLNTGSSVTTTATYDETGQMVTSVDGCGNSSCSDMQGSDHTTHYSYADSFSGGSPQSGFVTNAYLTAITPPAPNGVSLATSYSYRYSDGQVASVTDANNKTTTYGYADPLNRLTMIQGPPDPNNGGQQPTTSYSYNDAAPSPSFTESVLLNTSGALKTTVSTFDGMSHLVQTQLPNGAIIYTAYTGLGQVLSTSNPHLSGSPATDGTTTFQYDALGRTTAETLPDNNQKHWCYNGTPTTTWSSCPSNQSSFSSVAWANSKDEAGNLSQQVSDSFGRLVSVMEQAPSGSSLSLETDYGYDALSNMTSVNQVGGSGNTPLARGFSYDSLSRLQASTNPETGTIQYTYDSNGNVSSRTDARGVVTSYNYDALNRNTSISYVNPANAPATLGVTNSKVFLLRRQRSVWNGTLFTEQRCWSSVDDDHTWGIRKYGNTI